MQSERDDINSLISLSKNVPYQELNWFLSYNEESLFLESKRISGTQDYFTGSFIELRKMIKTYVPASIYKCS